MVELILSQSGVVVTLLTPISENFFSQRRFSRVRRMLHSVTCSLSFPEKSDPFSDFARSFGIETAELFLDKFSNKATQQVVPLVDKLRLWLPGEKSMSFSGCTTFCKKRAATKSFLVTLQRISGEEMAKMLSVLFDEGGDEKGEGSFSRVNAWEF